MSIRLVVYRFRFEPTCHKNHLPGFVKRLDDFKAKGVDVIAVLAANDPFVMSGWLRFNGIKDQVMRFDN
jgi:alkyl hydroperoxide reductase 1